MSEKLKQLIIEAEKAEENQNYMAAAHYYKQAMSICRNLGDSANLKLFTGKFVEMNKLSTEHQMVKREFKTPISEEDAQKIESQIEHWTQKPLEEVLEFLGRYPRFYPETEETLQSSEKTMPLMMKLASNSSVTRDGHLVKGSTDGETSWYFQMYNISHQLKQKLLLNPLLERLIDSKKLTADTLFEFINRNSLIRNEIVVKHGVEAFFDGDYISALHILVPQFEKAFLDCSNALGLTTVKINRGQEISTEPITFSEVHLEKEEFQITWGRDFCEYLNFVLFKSMGIKLRHKVAHGDIVVEECNFDSCALMLYFFIAISARVVPTVAPLEP